MANDDYGKVLSNVLVELASSDKSRQAAASAAAAVLLAQAPEGVTLSLSVVPAVLPLLNSDSQLIQRNACAALIAVAEAEAATLQAQLHQWDQALKIVTQQLAADETNVPLRITSAEVLGAVGSTTQNAAEMVFEQQGIEALLTTLQPQVDSALQEAGLDSLCKLAAESDNRQHLTDKGVLIPVVKMLMSSSSEVQVRALLCLGMLMGDNQQQQVQLADTEGALLPLLELRLQKDDEDCRQIADGIIAAMLKNPGCKQQLTDALRSKPQPSSTSNKSNSVS